MGIHREGWFHGGLPPSEWCHIDVHERAALMSVPCEDGIHLLSLGGPPEITQPCLLIWGDRDAHLGPELTQGLEQWVPSIRIEHLPDASHWVLEEAPEQVTQLILDFVGARSA